MNWDDLKLFLAVSRQPKLDKAAASLHQDPTTVSRRLRRLETNLGQTLFERTRRGHILTPAGDRLASQAERAETIFFAIQSHREEQHSVSGRIRLGVTEGLGAALIAPALTRFRKQWPSIDLDLIALSGFVSVPKREADMSILLTRPKAGRIRVRKLTDYTLHLYGTRDYLTRNPIIDSVDSLNNHTLIGYVDDLIYSPQLRYFDEVLPGLAPSLCSSSILAQCEMARNSAGICILPRFIASQHKELEPVLQKSITVSRSFWLTIHEDVSEFSRIRALTDFLVGLMKGNRTAINYIENQPQSAQ